MGGVIAAFAVYWGVVWLASRDPNTARGAFRCVWVILSGLFALLLITREFHLASWLIAAAAAFPFLVHMVFPLVYDYRPRLAFALLWAVSGFGFAFVLILSQSLLAMHNGYPIPLLLGALGWFLVALLIWPLSTRHYWPEHKRDYQWLTRVFWGFQSGAILLVFLGSLWISWRAEVHGGPAACIQDTYGARYHSTFWASPIRFFRNEYKGTTLAYLTLYDGQDALRMHWSFRAMDFVPDETFAFGLGPRFFRAPKSEIRC